MNILKIIFQNDMKRNYLIILLFGIILPHISSSEAFTALSIDEKDLTIISIVAIANNPGPGIYHGLTIDEPLASDFWETQPCSLLIPEPITQYIEKDVEFYLPNGKHTIEYGNSASCPDNGWKAIIFIEGKEIEKSEIAKSDCVGNENHLIAEITIENSPVTAIETVDCPGLTTAVTTTYYPSTIWAETDSKHYTITLYKGDFIALPLSGEQVKNPFSEIEEKANIKYNVQDGAVNFYVFDKSNYEYWENDDPQCCTVRMQRYDLTSDQVDIALDQFPYVAVLENSGYNMVKVTIDVTMLTKMKAPTLSLSTQIMKTPTPGQSFEIQIIIENNGEAPANDVEVTLELPEGLTSDQATKSIGKLVGQSSKTITFSLEGNSLGEYTINIHVNASNAQPLTRSKNISIGESKTTTITTMAESFQSDGMKLITLLGFIIFVLYQSIRRNYR